MIRYFQKFSKLDVSMVWALLLSLRAQGTLIMYKVFLFSSSVVHHFMHKMCLVKVWCYSYCIWQAKEILKSISEMFHIWIQRHQSEIFKMNQSESFKINQSKNYRKTSCFLRGPTRTNQKKAKWNLDPKISDLFSILN